jgi:carboxylesterase
MTIETRKPTHPRFGVLLLHGFTSSVKTVSGLLPYLEKEGLPVEMPILRGHGKRPEFLIGVTYRDWINDAKAALDVLLERCDKVIVVGLSMGALVALELGMHYPEKIIAVVTVAPALRFTSPLAPLVPFLNHVLRYFPAPNAFVNKELSKESENYPRFPVSAFASLYEFTKAVEARLPCFDRPLLILQHRKNQVTHPKGATIIYDHVSSKQKEILWFEESGHEMMQDCEREAVFATIVEFVRKIKKGSYGRAG